MLEQWRFWWEAAAKAALGQGWTLSLRFDFFPGEPWLDGAWYHLTLVIWVLGWMALGARIWGRDE